MAMLPVFIVGIIFVSILLFVKILSDNHIRNKLIEKGMVDEKVKYLYRNRFDSNIPSSLKWGIVLICIGLAFLVGHLIAEAKEEVTIASMFLFAGGGLIAYYFIVKRMNLKAEEESKK